MNTEISTLEKWETWVKVNKYQIPANVKILPRTWDFKSKRALYGSLRKYKAILCVQGDIQKQITTEPTNNYVQLVKYSTIRMLLIMKFIISLKTKELTSVTHFARKSQGIPSVYALFFYRKFGK